MPLESDVTINASKFRPNAISEQTSDVNNFLVKHGDSTPRWWEVGPAKWRALQRKGQHGQPAPVYLDSARVSSLPSRETGRDIPIRIFTPESGQVNGVFLHLHGGGWVLYSESDQDAYLKFISDSAQLTVISIGYRLAPEHLFPAGPEDCYDAAEYLVDNAKKDYGAELLFAGGESAGAHLSTLVCFHLIKSRPSFSFNGLVLHFGAYDLSAFLPQVHNYPRLLVIDGAMMDKFVQTFIPDSTPESRRDPAISPLFANLGILASKAKGGRLPPALFTCGTEDCLLDDSMFMGVKWQMSGAESVVRIYPGAAHGFIGFPHEAYESAKQGWEDVKSFLLEKTL